jgi:hypothetical protein
VDGGASLGQRAGGVAVPCGAYRWRDLVVQGGADQRVAKRKLSIGLPQHTRGAGLVDGVYEVGYAPVLDDREIVDQELEPQQGGGPQVAADVAGQEVEPVGDRGEE